MRFTKKLTITLSALTLLCCIATSQTPTTPTKPASTAKPAKNVADDAKGGDFYVSNKDHAEFQTLQMSLTESISAQSAAKRCHVEYRNCWTDKEWRCPGAMAMYPGSTMHCEEVPVRRCGKPETVCN
jgi:hypothetical protein